MVSDNDRNTCFYIPTRSSLLVRTCQIVLFCLSHYLYTYALTYHSNKKWKIMYNVSLLLHFFIFFLDCLFITNCTHAFWYVQFARASVYPITWQESPNTFESAAPRTYSIICISSESCLGSIVGLPGSCACCPTFRYIS